MALALARAQRGFLAHDGDLNRGFETLRTMDDLRRYNQWLWSQVSPHIGQRVFEAGCGLGTFTRKLQDRERLVSVDLDPHYVNLLRREYAHVDHVRVEQVDLATAEWPQLRHEALDTVVSMNVLEHLRDDHAVLRRFWDVLRPGGRLALVVPAHARLFGAIDEAVGHFRRYERRGLTELLGRSGFEVDQVRHLNPTGVLGWFLNGKLLRRSVLPRSQATWYDRVYPALSLLERLGLPFGLSLLAIARKPLIV